jgi:hypothetical protein
MLWFLHHCAIEINLFIIHQSCLSFLFYDFSHVSQPFGKVRSNFVDVMGGNIFGLANEEHNSESEMATSHKSHLTSKIRHVYKVS